MRPPVLLYEISVPNAQLLDRLAREQYAIPSIVLMENAAIALREHALEMLSDAREQSVVIFAGPGNNAGDGFALARHLSNREINTTIITICDPETYKGDARTNFEIMTKMDLKVIDAGTYLATHSNPNGLLIDALFGTGLTRPITGIASELIAHINTSKEAGAKILAVDVPSGLNAQTGEPMGECVVHADRTITFVAFKEGMRAIDAQPFLGEVFVADIGIPLSLLKSLAHPLRIPHAPH